MLKLKNLSGRTMYMWASDEYASWEDDGCPETGHVYPILQRHRTVLEIRNEQERTLVITSGEYFGDASAFDDDAAYHIAVGRIVRMIKEAK